MLRVAVTGQNHVPAIERNQAPAEESRADGGRKFAIEMARDNRSGREHSDRALLFVRIQARAVFGRIRHITTGQLMFCPRTCATSTAAARACATATSGWPSATASKT